MGRGKYRACCSEWMRQAEEGSPKREKGTKKAATSHRHRILPFLGFAGAGRKGARAKIAG